MWLIFASQYTHNPYAALCYNVPIPQIDSLIHSKNYESAFRILKHSPAGQIGSDVRLMACAFKLGIWTVFFHKIEQLKEISKYSAFYWALEWALYFERVAPLGMGDQISLGVLEHLFENLQSKIVKYFTLYTGRIYGAPETVAYT